MSNKSDLGKRKLEEGIPNLNMKPGKSAITNPYVDIDVLNIQLHKKNTVANSSQVFPSGFESLNKSKTIVTRTPGDFSSASSVVEVNPNQSVKTGLTSGSPGLERTITVKNVIDYTIGEGTDPYFDILFKKDS